MRGMLHRACALAACTAAAGALLLACATGSRQVAAQANGGLFAGTCSNPNVRMEWRSMTAAQQQAYLGAVSALKARNPGPPNQPAAWNYDQFTQAHLAMNGMAHRVPAFLPWWVEVCLLIPCAC